MPLLTAFCETPATMVFNRIRSDSVKVLTIGISTDSPTEYIVRENANVIKIFYIN